MMYLDSEKDEIQAMPVVVLKNFAAKGNRKNELWNTIAEWSASLVENKVYVYPFLPLFSVPSFILNMWFTFARLRK